LSRGTGLADGEARGANAARGDKGRFMKRVLFVDRDVRVAEGLRDLARAESGAWEIAVASDNESALTQIGERRFDVVITELRAAQLDGPSLLRTVQELSPTTARIILSTSSRAEASLQAVSVAQQFLTKPCNAVELRNTIVRTCNLQELLHSDSMRGMIGELSTLPSVPRLYTELQHKLDDPDAGARDIAAVIERDPAMSAKILQLSNSALFGVGRNVASVRDAVALMGFGTVKNLVMTLGVFHSFSDYGRGLGLWIEALQNHSLQAARIAAGMFTEKRRADDAFLAAVLHDTGKLVLATQRPQYLREVLANVRARRCPMHIVERELSGITHAEIGGYLLGLWGLPYPIVEATAYHHAPQRVEQLEFDLLAAVRIANILANEAARGATAPQKDAEAIEPEYLTALGVADRLDRWRTLAESSHLSKVA
jgi:HD-like signal output (HDOD) protein